MAIGHLIDSDSEIFLHNCSGIQNQKFVSQMWVLYGFNISL